MALPPKMAALVHDAEVIEERRQRHAHPARHLGRRERRLLQEKAVDRVFVGPQVDVGEGRSHQAAHPLVEDEQVEEEGDFPSRLFHRPQIINHGSVVNTTMSWYRDSPMRRREAALATLLLFLGGCAPASPARPSPSPQASIQISNFERYAGAYRTSEGITYVVNGHGHLLNLQDSNFRQLYPTSVPNRFTIGRAFAIPSPKQADVIFRVAGSRGDQLTMKPVTGSTVVAGRLLFKETEVRVPADGAVLAATITEPLTPGPHPGIVIVHGSEPGQRIFYGVWVGLYASLGLTVLTYDKRGNGASTGVYPGEFPTDSNLAIYAADAANVLRFLASWPGVDPKRVGFHGGSQGGWTRPLPIARHQAPAAFAILVSGPAGAGRPPGGPGGFSAPPRNPPPSPPPAACRPGCPDDHPRRPAGWPVSLARRQSSVKFGARCRRTRPNGLRPSRAWMKR